MAKEEMVTLVWPNGYTGACRKSMAERLVKKHKARKLSDVHRDEVAAEKAQEAVRKKKTADAKKNEE